MTAGFEPSMIGAVVKVTTTNTKDTETRTVVGRLVNFSGFERTGERATAAGWFRIEGEPEEWSAFDEGHSSAVEVFAPSALDQLAMVADGLQSLRTVFLSGDLFIPQLAGAHR